MNSDGLQDQLMVLWLLVPMAIEMIIFRLHIYKNGIYYDRHKISNFGEFRIYISE